MGNLEKIRNQYPLNAKNKIGLSLMGWMSTGASSFMTSMFMLYLTDYSNIGAMAATLGTVLLFVGRIVDAVDDPVQGWIMDSAKPTKFGKYRFFIILSILISAVALIALYTLPGFVTNNAVMTVIYVLFFYLLYDIGTSFYCQSPLLQTMSDDTVVRGKLFVYPRVFGMLVAIPFAFILQIITSVNNSLNNMHNSFALVTVIMVAIITVISIVGILLVKEGNSKVEEEETQKITFKDIINLFKTNKPLLITKGGSIFGGFVWTLIFAATTYYAKYRFCADITTGVVDNTKFGTVTTIIGMMQMLPLMLGALIGPWLLKKLKDPMFASKLFNYVQAGGLVLMFVFNLLNVFDTSAGLVIFIILLFFVLFACGCNFIPGSVLGLEVMDYGIWKTGKEMNAMCNAVDQFISKAQTAISSATVGVILIAMGYVVDSVTGNYSGDLANLPKILDSFMIISALVPAIFLIINNIIYHFYPINDKVRAEMKEALHK